MFYRCPRCAELFAAESTPMTRCAACGVLLRVVPAAPGGDDVLEIVTRSSAVPWEAASRGAGGRLFSTLRALLRSAPQFFHQLDDETSGKHAESFAYLVSFVGLAGYFSQQLWFFSSDRDELARALAQIAASTGHAPTMEALTRLFRLGLFLSPVLAAFPAHVAAGLYAMGLRFVGVQQRGYDVTFRVAAYGLAPMLLLAVPGIGLFVAPGWILALHWIGLAAAHRFSLALSAFVMAIPLSFFTIIATSALGRLLVLALD